jgi:hypothetical protein
MSGQTTLNQRMTRSLYIRSLIIGPTYDAGFRARKSGSLAAYARHEKVQSTFDATALPTDERHSVRSN